MTIKVRTPRDREQAVLSVGFLRAMRFRDAPLPSSHAAKRLDRAEAEEADGRHPMELFSSTVPPAGGIWATVIRGTADR